jgi:tripartite-type tricarboxylate transporter receptor subunit TctC
MTVTRIAGLLIAAGALLGATQASAAEDFYKGKRINLIVSGGGSYEEYARLVAKYMPKYIPGEPSFVVKALLGSSGLKATNYMSTVAPKDGTEIAAVHGHIPTAPIFDAKGAEYDPTKLEWVGSVTKEIYVGYMWKTSPVQTLDDTFKKESVVGGGAVGSLSVDMPMITNALLGTKFKVITGYTVNEESNLAVQRGELNGKFGTTWTSLLLQQSQFVKDKSIKVIAQFGRNKHKDLPDVPLLLDAAKGDARTALELYLARQETGKPYFAPPGTPKDRVDILRRAFDQVVKDPDFVADCEKTSLEVTEPMSGAEIQAYVAEMSKASPAAIKMINDVFAKAAAK